MAGLSFRLLLWDTCRAAEHSCKNVWHCVQCKMVLLDPIPMHQNIANTLTKQSAGPQFSSCVHRNYTFGPNTIHLNVNSMVANIQRAQLKAVIDNKAGITFWLGRSVMAKSCFREPAILGRTWWTVITQTGWLRDSCTPGLIWIREIWITLCRSAITDKIRKEKFFTRKTPGREEDIKKLSSAWNCQGVWYKKKQMLGVLSKEIIEMFVEIYLCTLQDQNRFFS